MKNKSIWIDNINFNEMETLNKSISVDVLIVGGGITGLSTAYHLRNSNLNVCLVEKNLIAHGITSKTTGKLTYLQEDIYTKLKDKGILYYESQKEAISIVEKIIKDNNIDCDYKKVDSYIYAIDDRQIFKIKKEEEALKKIGVKYKIHSKLPNNMRCNYAISVGNTAVFHPIKYLNSLKEIISTKVKIYENSLLTDLKKIDVGYVAIVNDKKITAKKVIIATHYPFFISPLFLPLRTYIERSYIIASRVNKINKFSAITVGKPIKSIRYHEDNNKYLIYLEGSHNLCSKYNYKESFNKLKNNNIISYMWSNHDIMTEDNLPYIGYIDDSLLIGTGYNTWGMTNGSLAGKIISDLLLFKKNKYQNLFNPKRNIALNKLVKYSLYAMGSVKSIVENKIIKNKSWYPNNVYFTKLNNENVAIYIDEFNKKHIVYNLCPHMKCSLIFNEIEKTWDCPCHGSRFDIDGNCIIGPSKYNITYRNKTKNHIKNNVIFMNAKKEYHMVNIFFY